MKDKIHYTDIIVFMILPIALGSILRFVPNIILGIIISQVIIVLIEILGLKALKLALCLLLRLSLF